MNLYFKFFVQVVVAAGTAVIAGTVGTTGTLSDTAWVNAVIVTLGAVAVLGAGELPAGVWANTKIYVSAGTAGAVALASLIGGSMGWSQWLQVGVATIGVFGVAVVPGPKVVEGNGRHEQFD